MSVVRKHIRKLKNKASVVPTHTRKPISVSGKRKMSPKQLEALKKARAKRKFDTASTKYEQVKSNTQEKSLISSGKLQQLAEAVHNSVRQYTS